MAIALTKNNWFCLWCPMGCVHLGDLWGWAGSLMLFVCGKVDGEPAPTNPDFWR